MRNQSRFLILAFCLSFMTPLLAQDRPAAPQGAQAASAGTPAEEASSDQLRKQSQNPVANLISVPIQNNSNFGIEPGYRTQNILNIQPVIPFSMGKNWNLITRWIMPVIYQPISVPQASGPPTQISGVNGLGDINPSFFLSPKKSKVIWGVGPTFVLPTATNTTYLGQGKLSMGPSVVALVQPGPFTIGALANNYWSVAGHSNQDKPAVNQFLLQYFFNYNLKKGWYLGSQPIITANWRAKNGNVWTVPWGGGVGRVMSLGKQPVNINAQFYGNSVYPSGGSPWSMRIQIAFLFPKRAK